MSKGTSIVKRNQSTWGEGGSVGEGVWVREVRGEGGRERKRKKGKGREGGGETLKDSEQARLGVDVI